jgi:hypothetical protein
MMLQEIYNNNNSYRIFKIHLVSLHKMRLKLKTKKVSHTTFIIININKFSINLLQMYLDKFLLSTMDYFENNNISNSVKHVSNQQIKDEIPSPIHPNTSFKKKEEKKLNLYDSNKKNFEDYQDYTCKNFHEYDTTIKKVE